MHNFFFFAKILTNLFNNAKILSVDLLENVSSLEATLCAGFTKHTVYAELRYGAWQNFSALEVALWLRHCVSLLSVQICCSFSKLLTTWLFCLVSSTTVLCLNELTCYVNWLVIVWFLIICTCLELQCVIKGNFCCFVQKCIVFQWWMELLSQRDVCLLIFFCREWNNVQSSMAFH